jgi:GTP:adenosylcobinamide-phosphate guanylyltransferase
LAASESVGRIAVCAPQDAEIAALCARAGADLLPASATPAGSVLDALETLERPFPILLATADHPLLTQEMVDVFAREAEMSGGDIAVALASRAVVRAAYPDAVRTYLPFRDDGYSGCNLFALLTPRAEEAVRFWRRIEAERKRPWRLVRAFGPLALLAFASRMLTLDRAMRLASRRLGLNARAIRMPFAEAAIDVDKPADLALAERILTKQGS